MILAMKLISLAFDLDSGAIRDMPGVWDYAGYSLHVGSVIFGPWISFQEYSSFLQQPEERLFVSALWFLLFDLFSFPIFHLSW